jgi:hypothetical protein
MNAISEDQLMQLRKRFSPNRARHIEQWVRDVDDLAHEGESVFPESSLMLASTTSDRLIPHIEVLASFFARDDKWSNGLPERDLNRIIVIANEAIIAEIEKL